MFFVFGFVFTYPVISRQIKYHHFLHFFFLIPSLYGCCVAVLLYGFGAWCRLFAVALAAGELLCFSFLLFPLLPLVLPL